MVVNPPFSDMQIISSYHMIVGFIYYIIIYYILYIIYYYYLLLFIIYYYYYILFFLSQYTLNYPIPCHSSPPQKNPLRLFEKRWILQGFCAPRAPWWSPASGAPERPSPPASWRPLEPRRLETGWDGLGICWKLGEIWYLSIWVWVNTYRYHV